MAQHLRAHATISFTVREGAPYVADDEHYTLDELNDQVENHIRNALAEYFTLGSDNEFEHLKIRVSHDTVELAEAAA